MTVIDLQKVKAQRGEQSFLCCGCQKDDNHTGFAPVLMPDLHNGFIASLVCLNCGEEIILINGRIHEED